jgi:hypothetical protein
MEQQRADNQPPLALPARISEGMPVHDRNDQPIGHVQLVYYGGASEEAITRALQINDAAIGGERGALDFGEDRLAPELRARLMRHGYIRIEGPGIAGDRRYVTAEQIGEVVGERVLLRASRDELIG